jgi:4-hydroxy-4-methyl-2-oxoglutarate aldolase
MPPRSDLDKVVMDWGKARGWSPRQNTWVIDNLVKDDVVVVDLFGKLRDGTFAGDNLATAIKTRTSTGMVVDGGIRDARQIEELDGFNAFVRGIDPSAIAEVTLVGVNVPIRIGGATVLPGDLVLGTSAGVTFIPPALVEEIVLHSEETRLRDEFGKQRLSEGKYTSSQIDTQSWEPEIQSDYLAWKERRTG